MPYASGPSVRRLSKIATLLLAKNYIVMLQRTVDELQRLLVHPRHHQETSTRTRTPTDSQRPPSPYDDIKNSAPASKSHAGHRASTPLNVDAVQTPEIASSCVLPPLPPPPEVILAMTSLPSAMLNEQFRSQLSMRQPERVAGVPDWPAAVGWQCEMVEQRRSGVPLAADAAAMIRGQCHRGTAAGGRLLLPWIDCASHTPLMTAAAARLQPLQPASIAETHHLTERKTNRGYYP